jgi:hypothetical protein
MARRTLRALSYALSVVRFVAIVGACLVAASACSDSTHRSRGPAASHSTTSVAVVGRNSTHTCLGGDSAVSRVLPTPTLMATARTYGKSLRLSPPPRHFRPASSPEQVWRRWLSGTNPCERDACGRSAVTSVKVVLATAAWDNGYGYGVGKDLSHVAWAVLTHFLGPPPTWGLNGPGPHPTKKMKAQSRCYVYDTFDTYDANTGRPYGGSMGLGSPA